jgi:hypothetical protein
MYRPITMGRVMPKYIELDEYPDLLGALTGGNRVAVGPVECALAVRPRAVRAGKSFSAYLLVQNMTRSAVELQAVIHLPERDANNERDRFTVRSDRLTVEMLPAEIGYVELPVACNVHTAVGRDYTLSVDVRARALDRNAGVITHNGVGVWSESTLTEAGRARMEALQALHFTAQRYGLRGQTLQVGFSVMSGKVGSLTKMEPEWHNVWKPEDGLNPALLLLHYGDEFMSRVVPYLTIGNLYPALWYKVVDKYASSGYDLTEVEIAMVTKLLTMIILYTGKPSGPEWLRMAEHYDVKALIHSKIWETPEKPSPRWITRFLLALHYNERILARPAAAIAEFAFEELFQDGLHHGFHRIALFLNADVGGERTREKWIRRVNEAFAESNADFATAFMPLVLGGMTAFDLVLVEGETIPDTLYNMHNMMMYRNNERNEKNEGIFRLAEAILREADAKYHSHDFD